MRVAIAGGNGFIGRRLTHDLLSAGYSVVWLSHTPGRVTPPAGVREVAFRPDDRSGEWWAAAGEADAVVNLSGYPIASRWNARVKKLLRTSRIDTTAAIVASISEARAAGRGPSVLVNASGVGVYGDGGDAVLTEDAPIGGDFLSDLARDWEAAALAAEASGCRVVIVRTGLVLGDEGLLPKLTLPMKLFVGGPVGNGRQWTPWVHIADLSATYRHAVECDALRGPVNAVAPEPVRMSEFTRTLGRVLGRPSWLPVPGFMLRIVLGEVAPYTLMSQRASSAKLRDSGFRFAYPKLEGAFRDLLGRD